MFRVSKTPPVTPLSSCTVRGSSAMFGLPRSGSGSGAGLGPNASPMRSSRGGGVGFAVRCSVRRRRTFWPRRSHAGALRHLPPPPLLAGAAGHVFLEASGCCRRPAVGAAAGHAVVAGRPRLACGCVCAAPRSPPRPFFTPQSLRGGEPGQPFWRGAALCAPPFRGPGRRCPHRLFALSPRRQACSCWRRCLPPRRCLFLRRAR